MKKIAFILLMLAAPEMKPAEPAEISREVDVYVTHRPRLSPLGLFYAQAVATSIYADIGIRLRWHSGSPISYAIPARLVTSEIVKTIVIEFIEVAPPERERTALAAARPYMSGGVAIELFCDRLAPYFRESDMIGGSLLGHVIAHEIGHVLQKVARHSESGVMKGTWTSAEIHSMPRRRLSFTDLDLKLFDLASRYEKEAAAKQGTEADAAKQGTEVAALR